MDNDIATFQELWAFPWISVIQTPPDKKKNSDRKKSSSSSTIISSYQISIKICYVQVMCSNHVSFELKRKSKVICTQRSYKFMLFQLCVVSMILSFIFSCWNDDFACQRSSNDQMDYEGRRVKKYKFFLIKIQVGLFQNDLLYMYMVLGNIVFWRCFFGEWPFLLCHTYNTWHFCNCAFYVYVNSTKND